MVKKKIRLSALFVVDTLDVLSVRAGCGAAAARYITDAYSVSGRMSGMVNAQDPSMMIPATIARIRAIDEHGEGPVKTEITVS
jgi:hypothetical protein